MTSGTAILPISRLSVGRRWWWHDHRYAVPAYGLALVALLVNVIISHDFFASSSLTELIGGGACLVVLAIAATVPMLAGNGGIDISIAPLAGLVNVVVIAVRTHHTVPSSPIVIVVMALGMGLVSGAVIGALISYLRIQPIVATLGAYLIYTALAQVILQNNSGNGPGWLANLGGSVGPVPGGLIFVAAALALWLALGRTPYHRQLYTVGDNDLAAYASGIPVARLRMSAYMISGAMAAIAGLAITAYLNAGDGTIGQTFTLTAVAAAAIGGTSLAGGRGGVLGGLGGGLAVYLIENALSVLGIGSYWISFSFGSVLVLGIALNRLVNGQGRAGRPAR